MTRAGVGALVVGGVLVALGAVLVWPALVVLGSGALVATAVALGWVLRPPALQIDRQIHPDRVPKGAPALVYLDVTNTGRAKVPVTVALQPYGDAIVRAVLPELRGGERGVRTYRLPTSRRGVFEVGPLEVARSDPFELLRVVRRFGEPTELWVYPRILPLAPLPSGVTRNLEGPSSDTAPEGDITFHRLREYVTGDDLRMIHWKSTARTGRLMVRHNIDTSQPYTVVLVDLDPQVYSADSFETAVDVAASVVTASARGNAAVQLCLGTGERVGGPGERSVRPLVDRLTTVDADPASDVGRELVRLRRHRGGTALVVVTGAVPPGMLPALSALRSRFRRVVLVPVGDAAHPERVPGVTVVAAPEGERFAAAWNMGAGHKMAAAGGG
ncbi:MAG: DUF58 domain-containing protein [Actinomycetota bacterium]|nr:DUF58 domain-containing protein [Actinomycetota bacterium]